MEAEEELEVARGGEAADFITEAGGFEAGKLSVCAGNGCVGSAAILGEEAAEAAAATAAACWAAVTALEAAEEEAVVEEVVAEAELLAICWTLPKSRLWSK